MYTIPYLSTLSLWLIACYILFDSTTSRSPTITDLWELGIQAKDTVSSNYKLDLSQHEVKIDFDYGSMGTWFAQPLSVDLMTQRNLDQYPFVSIDYYISKANTFLDSLIYEKRLIKNVLRYQYDQSLLSTDTPKKPIIFMPSEYVLHFASSLMQLDVNFTLITVSNQPLCVPYITYPPPCSDPQYAGFCNEIEQLLANPYLDKWFVKNPCITHPKIHPLPIGPKWQWESRLFFDEDVTFTADIFRKYGMKPFSMFYNYSNLIYEDTHRNQFQSSMTLQELLLYQQVGNISESNEPVVVDIDIITELMKESVISNINDFRNYAIRSRNLSIYHVPMVPSTGSMINKEKYLTSLLPRADKHIFPGKDRLLYFNFLQDSTNKPSYTPHQYVRPRAYEALLQNGFQPIQSRQLTGYLQELSEFKFCISPPGIGIDTHRTWESLMVGTIPIVLSSPLDVLYEDLPVVIVDSYADITEEVLYEIYNSMHLTDFFYNFNKLFVFYWDSIIN